MSKPEQSKIVNFPSDIDAELENTQKQIDAADRKRQLQR
jgi:restriction endonuclease S subunit